MEDVDLETEAVVADPEDLEEPAACRVPTKPMQPLQGGRIEIDLDNPEGTAEFFELIARIMRKKGRIVFIVE